MMKTIVTGVICLLTGFGLGQYLPFGEPQQEKMVESGQKQARTHHRSGVVYHERIDAAGQRGGGIVLENLNIGASEEEARMVRVPTSLISQLSVAAGSRFAGQELFSRDGKAEQLLQITDMEKAIVQKAWRESRQKVRDLEVRASTSEDLEDGSVRITVPDITSGVASFAEGFQASVKDTLGQNRGDVFLAMKQVERVFTPASAERSYRVAVESIGDGRWRYNMTLEGAEGRRVWVSETIPNEIRHLTDAARIVPTMNSEPEGDHED